MCECSDIKMFLTPVVGTVVIPHDAAKWTFHLFTYIEE